MYYIIQEITGVCVCQVNSVEDASALFAEEGMTNEEIDQYLILSEEEYRELQQH